MILSRIAICLRIVLSGICLIDASNNDKVTNNNITNNGDQGITLMDANNNQLSYNNLTNNNKGNLV